MDLTAGMAADALDVVKREIRSTTGAKTVSIALDEEGPGMMPTSGAVVSVLRVVSLGIRSMSGRELYAGCVAKQKPPQKYGQKGWCKNGTTTTSPIWWVNTATN